MEKGMNMLDKEFDDLFRSKLGDFEVPPSAGVWQNIDTKLSGKKQKSIFTMLSIAASALILLAAGILFIPKNGAVKPGKADSNMVVKINPMVVKPEINSKPVNPSEIQREALATIEAPVNNAKKANQPKIKAGAVVQREQGDPSIAKSENIKPEEQPLIASNGTSKHEEVIKQEPIQLTEATSATIKNVEDNSMIGLSAQPGLVVNQNVRTAKRMIKKRWIRNFGDIVNLVVAKVDKGKDKLIQFSEVDDDESVISAVHLGALKIKRDN